MSEIHEALREAGLSAIYNDDGTINFDVIDACVKSVLDRQGPRETPAASPLDELSVSSWSLDLDIDLSTPDLVDASEEGKLVINDPFEFAFHVYVARMLVGDLADFHFDSPVGEPSHLLVEDPRFEPGLLAETNRYLWDLSHHEKARYGNLCDMHDALTPATNDINDLKCIVAIPVAGHQEHGNILRTLEQFAKQDLPASAFEVVLHLNLPAGEGERDDELARELQKTHGEITRFRELHPDISVRYVTNTYRLDKPTIGKIRSDLWDMIGLDTQKRGRKEDILVISADADIIHLNKQYLSGMVRTWQETGADLITANLRWQSVPGLPYDATVNRLLRWQTFLDNLRDNHVMVPHTSDANTGVSLAMYFAVGGFNRQSKLGEMHSLVRRILYYRQADKDAATYVPVKTVVAKSKASYLKTHSRRLVRTMALGRAMYEAWDQRVLEFGTDDELRTAEMEGALAERQAQANWKKWLKRDTAVYVGEVPLAKKRRVLKAARRILGFADLYN